MKIKTIKTFLKKIPFINYLFKICKNRKEVLQNYFAYNRLKRVSQKSRHSYPIKVGFLTQVPECWQKTEPVFNEMIKRKDFEVFIIQVPPFDVVNLKFHAYSKENEYFENLVDNKHTIKYEEFDVSSVDYLFYQRPYDPVYPNKLKSKNASKYTKLCYIPYATTDIKLTPTKPISFFRNLAIAFLEDDNSIDLVKGKFNSKYNFKYNKFLNLGYPAFEQLLKLKWRIKNSKNVLWTPRWSYDPIIGGSHFFEYVDFFTNTVSLQANLTIRPHPLMWDNFLKENRITTDKIKQYKKDWEERGIVLDYNENILDTFKNTDVMISDKSSILVMYFLTGKPIIYCEFDVGEPSELFKKILPGMYVVTNLQELEIVMKNLLLGEDPLKEERENIIKTFDYHKLATTNIINYLSEDYNTSSEAN